MRSTAVLMLLALVACGADTDGDGLSNADEKAFGSDPEVADSDADGLDDLGEFEAGSNPNVADTDGDTYLDLWEVNEGTSPSDAASRIYEGYWLYNPAKDAINWSPLTGSAAVGALAPNYTAGSDQFGQPVVLADMMGMGKPVIIDISAQWCPPCQQTAGWLAGTESAATISQFDSYFPGLRDAITAGDVIWVTILAEDNYGAEPGTSVLQAWDAAYPNHAIPVLNDPGGAFVGNVGASGFPTYHYVDGTGVLRYKNLTNSQYQDFGALERAMAEVGL